MGRVTPALLNKLLTAFKEDEMMVSKHIGLFRVAAATAQTLNAL